MGKTPEEVGAIDLPDIVALLEYWLDYPPVHLLLRSWTGFERKGSRQPDTWRAKRAHEMGDETYRPEMEAMTDKDLRIKDDFLRSTGARHLDCAPPHIQLAVERSKKGEHFAIAKPE